jgi:hypothetical protein
MIDYVLSIRVAYSNTTRPPEPRRIRCERCPLERQSRASSRAVEPAKLRRFSIVPSQMFSVSGCNEKTFLTK